MLAFGLFRLHQDFHALIVFIQSNFGLRASNPMHFDPVPTGHYAF
jgi:hypothetical protein